MTTDGVGVMFGPHPSLYERMAHFGAGVAELVVEAFEGTLYRVIGEGLGRRFAMRRHCRAFLL